MFTGIVLTTGTITPSAPVAQQADGRGDTRISVRHAADALGTVDVYLGLESAARRRAALSA